MLLQLHPSYTLLSLQYDINVSPLPFGNFPFRDMKNLSHVQLSQHPFEQDIHKLFHILGTLVKYQLSVQLDLILQLWYRFSEQGTQEIHF